MYNTMFIYYKKCYTLHLREMTRQGMEKPTKPQRLQILKKRHLVVIPCGLFVDEVIPYLGASPDGLIDSDSIIEVKCPSSASSLTPIEAIRSKKITFCIATKENGIKLKRNYNYFYQVQGELKIAKKKYCYFVV